MSKRFIVIFRPTLLIMIRIIYITKHMPQQFVYVYLSRRSGFFPFFFFFSKCSLLPTHNALLIIMSVRVKESCTRMTMSVLVCFCLCSCVFPDGPGVFLSVFLCVPRRSWCVFVCVPVCSQTAISHSGEMFT